MAETTCDFDDYAREVRDVVESALDGYTEFGPDCPAALRDAIRHSLLNGGKRLRAMLVLAAAEACGGDRAPAVPAACAVEMIHSYSLIHDDLPAMDDDDLRRGRPSCHKAYGEATAILAGDALQTRAFEILVTDLDPDAAVRSVRELADAAGASNLVGGQCDDLAAETTSTDDLPTDVALDTLHRIHRRKTGALIRAAARLGGITASASKDQLEDLARYGTAIGLAFQITDDLLDVHGNEDSMGKRVQKDAHCGKLTFPQLIGVDESRRRAEDLVAEACRAVETFGTPAAPLQAIARFVTAREN